MLPEERDVALLWDMREAAQDIALFVQGVTYERFASDKMLRFAVERQLMVIGEAAKRVSAEFRDSHPAIPWNSLIGQRNMLAHEAGEVVLDRIWLVATERIPRLVQLLGELIPPPPTVEEC